MKYFLFLTCLLSYMAQTQAQAQEACPNVWVFKANKTCAHLAHGMDLSQPLSVSSRSEWSGWVRGGKDQLQICRDVRDGFNARVAASGQRAELSQPGPTGERSQKDQLGKVTYMYACELVVTAYPGKVDTTPNCGVEEKWSYQVGGAKPLATASCLSCEPLASATPEEMANCLKRNITEIIQPKAIDLRDSDIAAVKEQVKRLLKINRYQPVGNLQSPKDIGLFIDFIEAQP